MENFILYEEIGKSEKSTVYKGRRKGTIKFLSILCIDKAERAAVTNWVRLIHEVKHNHIVRFHEWYETTNHLWMVTELCTGGTLEIVLKQDHILPENTIRSFGRDILSGLFYLHMHGVVFGDLSAKKILVDGPGILKLTNFCLSRLADENLHDIYLQASGPNDIMDTDLKGQVGYQAPEIKKGGKVSMAGDIWAFGALIYLMYTGELPLDDYVDPQLKRNNKNEASSFQSKSEISPEFKDLVSIILQKDPSCRPSVKTLINHPFWQGTIDINEEKDLSSLTESVTLDGTLNESILDVSNRESIKFTTMLSAGGDGDHSLVKNLPESVVDSTFTLSSRPHTANTISNTERGDGDDKVAPKVTGKDSVKSQKDFGVTYTVKKNKSLSDVLTEDDVGNDIASNSLDNLTDFIYHHSDIDIEMIQDNPQIKKVEPAKWDSKVLPFRALTNIENSNSEELYNHLKQVQQALNQSSSTSQARVRANVASYLSHLCATSTVVANYVTNSSMLGNLAVLVKNHIQQSPDVACRAARVIGLATSCSTELEQCTKLNDVFSTLSDALRENFRNSRAKQFLIPAVGQLLYLVAEHDQHKASEDKRPNTTHQKSAWSVPTAIFNLFVRCLREGEDATVQHFACKTIQVVANTSTYLGKKFISTATSGPGSNSSNEIVGPMLWSVAERSTGEFLKHSSLSALMSLNRLSSTGSVLQSVIDRVGLATFFSTVHRLSYKCQQVILTAFIETLNSTPKGQAVRIANSKDVLPSLMKFFENPSSIVRAKIALGVLLLMKRKPSLLITACHNRLIMYIERDCRRISTPSSCTTPKSPVNYDYIHACLNFLVRYMIERAPQISTSCVSVLDDAVGRKHPSSTQVKQMKTVLPSCAVLYHMITSQIFRSHIVSSEMIEEFGKLLVHVSQSIRKTSGLSSAIGENETQKFVDSVLSSIECLSQHPLVLTKYEQATMKSLMPQLINLLSAYTNNDGQMVCMKLITEVFSNILRFHSINMESFIPPSSAKSNISSRSSVSARESARSGKRHELPDICGIQQTIIDKLIPDLKAILQSRDPLPTYAVRLLGTLLEHWPSLCDCVASNDILNLLLSSFDELKSSAYNSSIQELTSVLNLLVRSSTDNVMTVMYERGLISSLLQYITEVSAKYTNAQVKESTNNITSMSQLLFYLLNLLKSLLERVTVAVKFALQSNQVSTASVKSQKLQTEDAEQLLVIHKPLTELQGICFRLLCDEQDLGDPALACISLLVQLFGGDHPDTMRIENMECFAQALVKSSTKSQRILLKLLKRIISLNDYHAEQFNSSEGSKLVEAVRSLYNDSNKTADANVIQLVTDVMQFIN